MESLLKPENQAASPAMVFACVCKKISSIPYVRLGVKPRGFKEFGPIVITYSDGKLHAHDCTLSNKTTAERLLKCMCIFQKHGKKAKHGTERYREHSGFAVPLCPSKGFHICSSKSGRCGAGHA